MTETQIQQLRLQRLKMKKRNPKTQQDSEQIYLNLKPLKQQTVCGLVLCGVGVWVGGGLGGPLPETQIWI